MKSRHFLVKQALSQGWFWAGIAAAGLLAVPRVAAEGTWIPLKYQAHEGIGTMLLLSDGTVMAEGSGPTVNWYRLAPDSTGGYTNSQWFSRRPMNYSRLYCASAVLSDGRLFIAGGEKGTGTTNAEVYNPLSDSWVIIPVPPGLITTNNTVDSNGYNSAGFLDSGCVLLDNGKLLISPVSPVTSGGTVMFDPVSNTLSLGPILTNNAFNTDEGGFVKLADGSVLVIDKGSTTSERYIPSLNRWVNDTNLPVALYDPFGTELGPGLLLPNGNAFFLGSTPFTGLYLPSGNASPGHWIQGPNIPANLGAPDAPGAMMPNGKMLCALSPTPTSAQHFPSPTYFYEYDYAAGPLGTFTQIHAPDGSYADGGPTWSKRMLCLPDGTILFTDGGAQLYVYVPDGSPIPAGKPTIYSSSWNHSGDLRLTGTLFNGISQGTAYGDDAQMDSNYPLVRFTDSSANVYYGRSYNWSSTGVQKFGQVVTTEATIPPDVISNPGAFSVQAVANGIASDPVTFSVPAYTWVDFNFFGTPQLGTFDNPFQTLAQAVTAVASGATIAIRADVQPSISDETMTISTPMTIISVYGPSTIGN